jgi:hypothetical protein
MNKNNLYSILRTGALMTALSLIALATALQSCDDDENEPSGTPGFSIEGDPSGLTSGIEGKTQSYVVRATGAWQIISKDEGDWVNVFPNEGKDDGTFKITVKVNPDFEPRVKNFAFVVNGEEQPVLFRVEQAAAVPALTVPDNIVIQSAGGNIDVVLTTNVQWTYTLSDDSWLTEVSKTANKVTLNAAVNKGGARSVTMTVTSTDFPELSGTLMLAQDAGNIVLNEDFNWLAYGSAVTYTTTGETRFDNWTPDEQAKGWTSTVNTVTGSGNTPMLYARQGFVKLGKTGYGGDLISPKLSTIEGTQNLKVTFKAADYISAGGAVDSKELVIEILGAGTPSTTLFIVENVPNDQADDDAGIENDIWADDRAFTFNVTGATADTQIRFIGKAFDLTAATPNKNRIFLDDIKVEVVE